MALGLSWTVEVGASTSTLTDITSRVVGVDIDQQLQSNTLASFKAQFTLNNDDGALTPGGGGTYTDTDWFSYLVRVTANITTTSTSPSPIVFDGIITGFDLEDDAVSSTVTISALDPLTVAGRTALGSVTAFGPTSVKTYLETLATYALFYASFPRFGTTNDAEIYVYDWSTENYTTPGPRTIRTQTTASSVTFADAINQIVLPAVEGWMWCWSLETTAGDLFIKANLVYGTHYFASSFGYSISFSDASNLDGTVLPFSRLKQAWTNGELINTATVKTLMTGSTDQRAINTTSANKYGSRAVTYSRAGAPSDAVALTRATHMANAYSTPKFIPTELTTRWSMIEARCGDGAGTNVELLLGADTAFLLPVNLEWTGTASDPQTATGILLGRRIRISPSDTTITLRLGSWADNTQWIIGQSKFGVNRLG